MEPYFLPLDELTKVICGAPKDEKHFNIQVNGLILSIENVERGEGGILSKYRILFRPTRLYSILKLGATHKHHDLPIRK